LWNKDIPPLTIQPISKHVHTAVRFTSELPMILERQSKKLNLLHRQRPELRSCSGTRFLTVHVYVHHGATPDVIGTKDGMSTFSRSCSTSNIIPDPMQPLSQKYPNGIRFVGI